TAPPSSLSRIHHSFPTRRSSDLDHQNVVSQPQDFFDLTGDHHDGGSLVDEPADQVVDLCSGAHVDTTGGLVQQEHVTAVHEPAGQHGFLLVSPGECADRAIRVIRCEVQCCDLFACCLALGVLVEETAASEAPEGGQGDVAVHGFIEQQSLALAFLGRQTDAAGDRAGDRAAPYRFAVHGDPSGGSGTGAVERFQDL